MTKKQENSFITKIAAVIIAGIVLSTISTYVTTTKTAEYNSNRLDKLEQNSVHQEIFNTYVAATQRYIDLLENNGINKNGQEIAELRKRLDDFIKEYSLKIRSGKSLGQVSEVPNYKLLGNKFTDT